MSVAKDMIFEEEDRRKRLSQLAEELYQLVNAEGETYNDNIYEAVDLIQLAFVEEA